MKKLLKILLGIVISVVIILSAGIAVARFAFPEEFNFAVTTLKQFGVGETIKLAYDFVTGNTLDDKSFTENKAENDKQLQDSIKNHGYNVTDEQLEKLNSGNLSEDEIADILIGNTPEAPDENGEVLKETGQQDNNRDDAKEDQPTQSETQKEEAKKETSESLPVKDDKKPAENQDKNQTAQKPEDNANTAAAAQDPRVAKLIAKMYVLKSRYTADIEAIIASMKAEYVTYPANERTTSLKASIATKYMNSITAMEAQCDAQVDAIVSELREVLKQTGADESLADSILSAYKAEKASTMSYYIGKYAD